MMLNNNAATAAAVVGRRVTMCVGARIRVDWSATRKIATTALTTRAAVRCCCVRRPKHVSVCLSTTRDMQPVTYNNILALRSACVVSHGAARAFSTTDVEQFNMIQADTAKVSVTGVGSDRLAVNGVEVRGSVMLFTTSWLLWDAIVPADITKESLFIVPLLRPAIGTHTHNNNIRPCTFPHTHLTSSQPRPYGRLLSQSSC